MNNQEQHNTIDYVYRDNIPIFQRCLSKEDGPCILQLGTANAELALRAAQFVEKDVDGIDVNMGCPKSFSTDGGMGAALLQNAPLAEEVTSYNI